ncbi:MAG: ATP-dependent sacrificial sulfur transferase LarE [Dermatophilus congolensis]|nr:ATP-dependent sacrificial sulfur transferase LarE [Dermatophilus congolensis]
MDDALSPLLGGVVSTTLSGRPQIIAAAVTSSLLGIHKLGVAYSGGVDSATLLALAVRALGQANVVAILGVSPSLPASERKLAHEVADFIGAQIVEVHTREGENPDYIANGPDRCFHCKEALFSEIDDALVSELGLDAVAYGENADDAGRPDRPGAFAATNHRVLRPLADAGLTKSDVREVAAALSLPVADKPASPCLASRIPHGEPVTPERLAQIEKAENVLRDLGFRDFRVRHHGDIARVEVSADALAEAVTEPTRTSLIEGVKAAGFRFVTLDLTGIQSGAFTLPIVGVTSARRSA